MCIVSDISVRFQPRARSSSLSSSMAVTKIKLSIPPYAILSLAYSLVLQSPSEKKTNLLPPSPVCVISGHNVINVVCGIWKQIFDKRTKQLKFIFELEKLLTALSVLISIRTHSTHRRNTVYGHALTNWDAKKYIKVTKKLVLAPETHRVFCPSVLAATPPHIFKPWAPLVHLLSKRLERPEVCLARYLCVTHASPTRVCGHRLTELFSPN